MTGNEFASPYGLGQEDFLTHGFDPGPRHGQVDKTGPNPFADRVAPAVATGTVPPIPLRAGGVRGEYGVVPLPAPEQAAQAGPIPVVPAPGANGAAVPPAPAGPPGGTAAPGPAADLFAPPPPLPPQRSRQPSRVWLASGVVAVVLLITWVIIALGR